MRVRWLPALIMVVAAGMISITSSGCKKSTTVEGEGGKQLTLHVDESVTITPGETARLKVSVERQNMDQAVEITVSDLPKGVTVKDANTQVAKGQKDVELILEADGDAAKVENHAVKVKAAAGELSATETVKTTVREKS